MIVETKYDTTSKVLEVTANGKKIKNVADVEFVSFGGDGEFFMEITTVDLDKLEDGVITRTHIIASTEGVVEVLEADASRHGTDPATYNYRFRRPMTRIEQVQREFDLNRRNKSSADLSKAFN